jgi:hypothetical protein|nr:MAG TPA: hypothetical protein [Caudoviricetes sp.]
MGLKLNSKISDLILAISEIITSSDGEITAVRMDIPGPPFYLEIEVKPKEEVQDDSKI